MTRRLVSLLAVAGPLLTETGPHPDLFIRAVSFQPSGRCAPGEPVFTLQVTVGNMGSLASPAITGKAMVQVMDQHGNGWGNGVPLGSIPPGGSVTASIPVYYLVANPLHMTGAAPHPFKAIADPLRLSGDGDWTNNVSAVIKVPAPLGCAQGR